ncbi:MAG: ABC-type transporter, periplasmic subunit [Eubacterium sp.]|jgi:iron complex transport system substrate-binding protein|nr:ABC-type transporter, periplasmic subunit [Eubacterium sp.]
MKKQLSLFLMTAIISASLLGCGSSKETSEVSVNSSAAESVAAETSQTGNTATEGSTAGATAADANNIKYPYKYVDAANRKITIGKQPVKVSISYLPHWETLMMLDVMPIATTQAKHYAQTWDPFKSMDLSSVVDLGNNEVNLELLADLEPDIILEQSYDINKIDVGNLEKIAPVVVFGEKVKMDWRYSIREIAKVVGKNKRAEEVISEIDKKLADSRVKLKEGYSDKKVMLMSLMGKDRYFCAYRPDLYDQEKGLGLNAPKGFPTEETYIQVSMEALVEMNPDYLFVNVFDGDEALLEELSQNSVWKSLKAVKDGHVFTLDGSGHACSVTSTVHTVDFIVETLLANK